MVERSYRGLLWTLVLVGTTLDQASKYGVFKWLYHDGDGGQQVIVPGVFKLLAQFTDQREPSGGLLAALRAGSGPILPKVNHGALFGLGGERETLPHAVFAAIGSACGLDPATMANTVFAAVSLLAENPNPSESEIRHGLEGNLCRCTGYHNIVKAVQAAATA